MHHNEHDSRHPHHRDLRHRREQQHPRHRHEEHFNDFRSRWGEPTPYIHLNHQGDWHPEDVGRFEDRGRFHREEEWLPDQQRRQHQQQQHEHRQQHPGEQHQEPIWRQRDVHFDSSNQRVEDRWFEDPLMPHPKSRRRSRDPRDDYWHERNR